MELYFFKYHQLSTLIIIKAGNYVYKFPIHHLGMSLALKMIEELEENEALRRRFLKMIIPEIPKEPDVTLMLINAILGRVATKEDLKEEISLLREEIKALDSRISSLEQRVARIEGQMSLFTKIFIAFNLPILLAVIGILLRLAF
jgi:predicted RNase H-like nuclease (RuvC/YqgF family)